MHENEPVLTVLPGGLDQHRSPRSAAHTASDGSRFLNGLRRRINDNSLASTATTVVTVLYGADRPGACARDDLTISQAYVSALGWTVYDRVVDTQADCRLPLVNRPGWNRVRAAIMSKRAHGVLAPCQAAITLTPRMYWEELVWFQDHSASLWLLEPETAS